MDILPQLLVNSIIAGSTYALASAGMSLTYGLMRILNFAHGHIMMVGAYLFYWTHLVLQWNMLSAAIASCLMLVILALFSMHFFVRPFSKFSPLLAFVTTLALSIMLESIISMVFGVNVKSLTVDFQIDSIEIAGVYITPIQILIISSAIIILSLLAFVVHCTSIGRRLRAVSEFKLGSEAIGINSQKINYNIFIFGCLLAAYAGVLVGYETNLQPLMGNVYTIKAFAAMILGGLGNIWGTVFGSYLLGLIENLSIGLDFGDYSLPAGYKDAFAFGIILLVLLIKPRGLFGTLDRRA